MLDRRQAPLFLLPSAVCLVSCSTYPAEVGAELSGYPAGVIAGFHAQTPLDEHASLTYRVAHNFTSRGDFGEHDDEEGGGFGGGFGYRRFLNEGRAGWLWGGRIDLWDLEIDWEDGGGTPAAVSGTTDVLVLQPTAEVGYGFRFGEEGWRLELTLGLGAEINIDTDGEDVGEGAILLLGATLLHGT